MNPADTQNTNEKSLLNENEAGFIKKTELEKDLLTWNAPSRPFKRRDKQFYLTTISIAGIVCLILFLAEGAMPVILIISLIFLYYVMSTVPPDVIEYKITNKGIKVLGKRTDWQNLGRFWFIKRYDNDILVVETNFLPNRMEIVIDSSLKEKIEKNLKIKNNLFEKYFGKPAMSFDEIYNEFLEIGKQLQDRIVDTELELNEAIRDNKNIDRKSVV